MKLRTNSGILMACILALIGFLLLIRGLSPLDAGNTALAATHQTIPGTGILTKTVAPNAILTSQRVTYTIQVRNETTQSVRVHLTDTLPAALISVTTPLIAHGILTQTAELLTWRGVISEQQAVSIRYSAVVSASEPGPVVNVVVADLGAQDIYSSMATVLAGGHKLYSPLIFQHPTPVPPTPTPPPPTPTPPPPAIPTVANGSFDAGPGVGWAQTSTNFSTLIIAGSGLPEPVTPHSPDYVAWLGGRDNEQATLAQPVFIPAEYSHLYLRYYYWSASVDTDCDVSSDVGYLQVNADILHLLTLCQDSDTDGWREKLIPMAPYGGQTVSIVFGIQLDGNQNSNLFVDDVSFCDGCGP